MPVEITSISPGRGRAADVLTVNGSGFSVLSNQVLFNGTPGAAVPVSTTQLTVTVPGGLPTDEHVEVVVTNNDTLEEGTWWWWSKPSTAALATFVLPAKEPGYDEVLRGLQNKDMSVAEAKYFERLSTLIEHLEDILAPQTLVAMSATGLVAVPSTGTAGEVTSDPTGVVGRLRSQQSLQFGGTIPAGTTTLFAMGAGAVSTVGAPAITEEPILGDGVVTRIAVYCRTSLLSRVVQADVLVNGVVQHTSEFLPGPNGGQAVYDVPGVPVVAGDLVGVQLRKNNALSAWEGRVGLEVV